MKLEDMPLYTIIFILGGLFGFFILLFLKIESTSCTPSQDTQQILSAISGTQLSMEMLITESLEFNCKK